MNTRRHRAPWVGFAVALTVLAFWNSTGQTRVFDDWSYYQLAIEAAEHARPSEFFNAVIAVHWSPAAWLIEWTNALLAGAEDDRLIRGLCALTALGGLLTLWRAAALVGLGPRGTLMALSVFALHRSNALAYYSYDVYTQQISDTLVWLSLVLAMSIPDFPVEGRTRRIKAFALGSFALALLTKEQGLAAVGPVVLMAAWFTWVEPTPVASGRLWRAAAGFGGITVAFLAAYRAAGAGPADSGAYQLCLSCAPANTALLIGGALSPLPTADVYLAIRAGHWLDPRVVLAAAGGGLTALLLLGGCRRWKGEERWRQRWPLLAAGLLVSGVPVVFLQSVRPLHIHAILFWLALAAGVALEGWSPGGAPRRRLAGAALVAACYVAIIYAGLRNNLGEIRATSDRARTLLAEIHHALDEIPPDAVVVLGGFGRIQSGAYSVLRMTTPAALLDQGTAVMVTRRGRGPRLYYREAWEEQGRPGPHYQMYVLQTGVVVVPPGPL